MAGLNETAPARSDFLENAHNICIFSWIFMKRWAEREIMEIKKWEYKVVNHEEFVLWIRSGQVEKKFNELGRQGWEFVGLESIGGSVLVFKRPLP